MASISNVTTPTGQSGRSINFSALLALGGDETITAVPADEQNVKVGTKTRLRKLLSVDCRCFVPKGQAIASSATDGSGGCCKATTLDLKAFEEGKGFSVSNTPQVQGGWRIRTMSGDFGTLTFGDAETPLRVTGIVPFRGDREMYDPGRAHVSWEYTNGLAESGRVALSADCPK